MANNKYPFGTQNKPIFSNFKMKALTVSKWKLESGFTRIGLEIT